MRRVVVIHEAQGEMAVGIQTAMAVVIRRVHRALAVVIQEAQGVIQETLAVLIGTNPHNNNLGLRDINIPAYSDMPR